MESPSIPISDESVFPLDSLFLTLGGVEGSHNISARSSIPRDKAVKKQTVFRHCTSKRTGNFDLTDLELHMRDVGEYGPRLLQYYGGNTLEAQRRTVNKIEEYRKIHKQSPIAPIGTQGPRGGESQLHWKCNICERIFDTFQKAAVHLTSCEWGLANWKCLEISCDRVYQSRNELVRHKSASHPHSSPDEYEDTKSAIPLKMASRLPTGPSHSHPTPPPRIPEYPLQGKVMPQYWVASTPASPAAVPQVPPAPVYDQYTRASSTMPHSRCHPSDRWSSPHVEASYTFTRDSSQKAVGDVKTLPTMRGPVTHETPGERASHRTQTMDSNGQWPHAGCGLNAVADVSSYGFDTSALFTTPSGSSNGTLTTLGSSSYYPISSFYSQDNLVYNQGLYQPSSQSSFPSLTPASGISYFMDPRSRNPAPDGQYTQQDRRFQQVQTQDRDTNVTDRNYPSTADAWLHHDSEFKAIALYLAAATSKPPSYPVNVPTVDRSDRFPSMNNGGNYVQGNCYQMDTA